jgi:lipoprotein-releasing system ATP-binding protein
MGEAVLELRALTKTYGIGPGAVPVLKGIDLWVEKGQFLMILGPSGSGKSTLLNILGLMDQPSSGDVLFSGRSANRLDEAARAGLRNTQLGFVFQFDSLLPEFTILENVMMPARIALAQGRPGDPANAEKKARALLRHLGLEGLAARFPAQTSGGERQRVALCRALINEPSILLADEPTGNLDKPNGELVFKDLKTLAESRGTAVVMVTHNEAAGRYADSILQMSDGVMRAKRGDI